MIGHAPHQRKPVGMHAIGTQPQQHIPSAHARRQRRTALHRSDGKAREIKVTIAVHSGHLGRLAPDQCTTRALATLGNAGNHPRPLFHRQLAGGKIIEEKQRLSPLTDQIIHAHCHQIDADPIQMARIDRDPQLGAHTIRGRHQNGIRIARRLEVEQAAKPAQSRHHPRTVRGLGRRGNPVHQIIARRDIDPGISVGQSGFLILRALRHGDVL